MSMSSETGSSSRLFIQLSRDPTIQRDMELIEHLDRLGAVTEAWVGEHHSTGWGYLLAGIVHRRSTERTKRVSWEPASCRYTYHQPLMVANRIIQLDLPNRTP